MRYLFIVLVGLLAAGCAQTMPADITVAADGTGNFTSVQQAVESVPKDNHQRVVILIKDGVYHEKVRVDASCVTLRGESRDKTRIEFPQLNDDFTAHPDKFGRAVVNLNGSDAVIENITVANTAGVIGPHAFAVFGTGDRIVIIDSDVVSDGADTVSLWRGKDGRYYHARCNFRGSVDFVCPRGWCYVTDCHFQEMKNTASVWHDGHLDKDMKYVLHNCKFDGAPGFYLARHHADAQFYFLDCSFAQNMIDRAPFRVTYPLDNATPTTRGDIERNKNYDKTNIWGNRVYFYNCHRDGGDYAWMKDNLADAPGSPAPEQITPAWTFAGKWNPEDTSGVKIVDITPADHQIAVKFAEIVTVKGKPRLKLSDGSFGGYAGGTGTETLLFDTSAAPGDVKNIDLNGGSIIASQAGATIRYADLTLPARAQ